MSQSLYDAIGVPPSATQEEIEAACIRLGEELNPANKPGNLQAAIRFKAVEQAYEILGNAATRKRYDDELLTSHAEAITAPPTERTGDMAANAMPSSGKSSVKNALLGKLRLVAAIVIGLGGSGYFAYPKYQEWQVGRETTGKSTASPNTKKLAMAAYTALRKIEATTEVGVRVADYGKSVGETWFDVKLFLESQEANSNTRLRDGIAAAMTAYKNAGAIWNLQLVIGKNSVFYFIDATGICLGSRDIMSYRGCEELDQVQRQMPEFDTYRSAPRRVTNPAYKNTSYYEYNLDGARQDQWLRAKEHLAEVAKEL